MTLRVKTGDPRREPLRRHFNDALRAGKWIAFGYSETLRKRVRIEAPWRDELFWDDVGHMLDGSERYSNVLFYQAKTSAGKTTP